MIEQDSVQRLMNKLDIVMKRRTGEEGAYDAWLHGAYMALEYVLGQRDECSMLEGEGFGRLKRVQDWEVDEHKGHGDYETVQIQIPTERKAITLAKKLARKYGRHFLVATSYRYQNKHGVQDRGEVLNAKTLQVFPSGRIKEV